MGSNLKKAKSLWISTQSVRAMGLTGNSDFQEALTKPVFPNLGLQQSPAQLGPCPISNLYSPPLPCSASSCCCCCINLVVSDSVRPHRQQPTRLPHPWDSPGKNTGVGCHFLLQCMKVKGESEVAQLCPTLATPWTAAYQAPPSVGFSRQKYWSGVPLPSPLLHPGLL